MECYNSSDINEETKALILDEIFGKSPVQQMNDMILGSDQMEEPKPGPSQTNSFSNTSSRVRLGSRHIEALLRSFSEDREKTKEKLNRSLLEVLVNGDVKAIDELINLGANPNAISCCHHISACHLAAMRSDGVLALLLRCTVDKYKSDIIGRTPLHLAAVKGNVNQLALLLGVPRELALKILNSPTTAAIDEVQQLCYNLSNIINVQTTVPIERRYTMNHHSCKKLEAYLPKFEEGWTPLHAASSRANHQCVRLLLAAGANPNLPDKEGRTPLDVAGSAYYLNHNIDPIRFAKTVELLLGCQTKLNRSSIHNTQKHLDTPLHTAVELNSKKAVEALMKVNVPIESLNRDGLTPVHICIKKKLPEILKVLTRLTNNETLVSAVDVRDKDRRTALHAAILDGWEEGVNIIICAGPNYAAEDIKGETPLYLAAANGNSDILSKILNYIYDQDMLNHALFKAVEHGHAECVKKLLEKRATVRTNLHEFNEFHLAASRGFVHVLKVLIDHNSNITKHLINLHERETGFGPIHYAVKNNHPECVNLLLSKNKSSNFKTSTKGVHKGSSPLHIAAIYNCVEVAKVLIKNDSETISSTNERKWTPLHYACSNNSRDMIVLLLKNGADLSSIATSRDGKRKMTAIELLMNSVSKPTDFLESIFNSHIKMNSDAIWPNFEIVMDYQVLVPANKGKEQMKVIDAFVKTGNRYKQRQLLTHPLIESFLNLKSIALLPFFYLMVCVYWVYLLILSTYVIIVFDNKDKQDRIIPTSISIPVMGVLMYIFLVIVVILEILYMNINARYFKHVETWIKLGAIGLAFIFPILICTMKGSQETYPRQIAAVVLVLSWLEMMFLLSRIPRWGYYMLMFGKVTRDVLKILALFSCLVIGFSLSFMILFHNKPPFDGIGVAFVKTLTMITTGFEYDDLIEKHADSRTTTDTGTFEKFLSSVLIFRSICIVFVVLAVVVLMNLMVGVAVDDIHDLQARGNIHRLIRQVEFLVSLDTLLYNEYFRIFLPACLQKMLLERKTISAKKTFRMDEPETISLLNKILPSDSINTLFELAQLQGKEMINPSGKQDEVNLRMNEKKIENITHKITALHSDVAELKTLVKQALRDMNDRVIHAEL